MQERVDLSTPQNPYLAELAARGTDLTGLLRLKLNHTHAQYFTLSRNRHQTQITRKTALNIVGGNGGEELAKWFLAVDAFTQSRFAPNYRAAFMETYVDACSRLPDLSIKTQAAAFGFKPKKMGWIVAGINTQLACCDMAQTIEMPYEPRLWLEYVRHNLIDPATTQLEYDFLDLAVNSGLSARTVNVYSMQKRIALDVSVVNTWVELMLCNPKYLLTGKNE